jgi:hypothetical protein
MAPLSALNLGGEGVPVDTLRTCSSPPMPRRASEISPKPSAEGKARRFRSNSIYLRVFM